MNTSHNNIEQYLSEIAERLWSGHASLMVGAGFSMNANKGDATAKNFPLWSDLGDIFYQKLYDRKPEPKDRCYLDILKLANEVEATFGRPTLNKILRDEIPNVEYQPSELHIKLLQLPWTDIFTTNYDTLLERTAEKVLEQRYETVVNKEDLIWSTKPRIIKLHGSFPSERPFIITEEDYRKYSEEYAPFVNTVQQSLLENTLCLIGFSGDDPNFLKWIGWIRDNLGKENTPKIFMIGKLSLSVGQKKLLEDRNVVPIDLSCYSDSHYEALFQFVEELKNKEGIVKSNLDYPSFIVQNIFFEQNKDIKPQFEKIIKTWKETRLSYPNWLILPRNNRERMWRETESGLQYISYVSKIDATKDIEFLYEFDWRMEKCLSPIFGDVLAYYENTINKYNPFPQNLQIGNAVIIPRNNDTIDWATISIYWMELQLSLLRHYREENLKEKWNTLAERLDKIKEKLSPELLARYSYERCLYYLFLLNIVSVRRELIYWITDTTLPYWEAKRAGLMAELGDIEDAEKILETSLNEIRNRLKLSPVTNDYALVSQEAYILLLLNNVRHSVFWSKRDNDFSDKTKKYSERWNELVKYNCDPWRELRFFESFLKVEVKYTKNIEKDFCFEIGHITHTHNFFRKNTLEIESYAFLRYIEEAGIHFRLPRVTFTYIKEPAKTAITYISKSSPNWGIVSFIRTGDSKMIDTIFGRQALAFMKQTECDELAKNYLDVLINSAPEIDKKGNIFNNDTFAITLSTTIPLVLSRFCVKCSYDVKYNILQFVKKLYLSDAEKRFKYKHIDELVKYLIKSFSLQEQYELIPELLEFPIIDYKNINPYPDVFIYIESDNINALGISINTNKIEELISFLLENHTKRKTASQRLTVLWQLGLLNEVQCNDFAIALWNHVDGNGFPQNTNLHNFYFLKIPHPKEINPQIILENYFKNAELPIQAEKDKSNSISMRRGDYPIFHNIIGTANPDIKYPWNKEDINKLVSNIIKWWNTDKEYLKQTDDDIIDSIHDEFKYRFQNMIKIFSNVIVSNIELLDSALFPQIEILLNELSEYGIPDLEAKVSFLKIFPNNEKDIYRQIRETLYSKDEDKILDAVNAVINLAINVNQDVTDLLKIISELIKIRTGIGLDIFINSVHVILKRNQQFITDDILNDISIGLLYLKNELYIKNDDPIEVVHEKLMTLRSVSRLLIALKKYYIEQNKNVPQYITDWENMCLDRNEFSEIRNIWING